MVPDHRLRGTTLTAAIAAGFVLGWVESLAVLASAGPLFAGVAFCFRACLIDAVMLLAAGATLQGCFELARRTRPGSSRERAWARRFSWLLGAGLFFATAFYLLEIYPTGHENKWSSRTLLLLAVSLVGCVLLQRASRASWGAFWARATAVNLAWRGSSIGPRAPAGADGAPDQLRPGARRRPGE